MSPTFKPSAEQQQIIEAGLVNQRVIACAGSGKTATAVRRLAEIRHSMGASRQYVALLSYSNVAVDTFRREYAALKKDHPTLSSRVLICTVDSFFITHVLAPYAASVMGCACSPFLVHGDESFLDLQKFKFFNGRYKELINHLTVSISQDNKWLFHNNAYRGPLIPVPKDIALQPVHELGKIGAYTHELGRYWCIKTLMHHDRLYKILAHRYPYILVDEAQDIGTVHGKLLNILMKAGVTVSLVGDPNQAIYEFANADGSFLRDFDPGVNGFRHTLSHNFRAIQPIADVANNICSSSFGTIRPLPSRKHGAYFLTYGNDEFHKLLPTFSEILQSNGYLHHNAVVLCRGNKTIPQIVGATKNIGQGATEKFAQAAICRDQRGDIADAFECAVAGTLKLLSAPPGRLRSTLLSSADTSARKLRQLIWEFLRSSNSGLPSASRRAKEDWLPMLKSNLETLLTDILSQCELAPLATWKNNVTKANLEDTPLWDQDLFKQSVPLPPVMTIHQAKGESIDAVLYVLKPDEINHLLKGPINADGRIGYVAVTRARDLLIVAIPESTEPSLINKLKSVGFNAWI